MSYTPQIKFWKIFLSFFSPSHGTNLIPLTAHSTKYIELHINRKHQNISIYFASRITMFRQHDLTRNKSYFFFSTNQFTTMGNSRTMKCSTYRAISIIIIIITSDIFRWSTSTRYTIHYSLIYTYEYH